MEVELEEVSGAEVETYRVRMVETDGKGKRLAAGIVKRAGPDSWLFSPSRPDGEPVTDVALTLKAKDREELRRSFEARFGTIDIPADRLRNSTTDGLTYETVASLISLASVSGSHQGFFTGLIRALATMAVKEVKPEKEREFVEWFAQQLGESITATRAVRDLAENIGSAVARMFNREDDDGSTGNSGPAVH